MVLCSLFETFYSDDPALVQIDTFVCSIS